MDILLASVVNVEALCVRKITIPTLASFEKLTKLKVDELFLLPHAGSFDNYHAAFSKLKELRVGSLLASDRLAVVLTAPYLSTLKILQVDDTDSTAVLCMLKQIPHPQLEELTIGNMMEIRYNLWRVTMLCSDARDMLPRFPRLRKLGITVNVNDLQYFYPFFKHLYRLDLVSITSKDQLTWKQIVGHSESGKSIVEDLRPLYQTTSTLAELNIISMHSYIKKEDLGSPCPSLKVFTCVNPYEFEDDDDETMEYFGVPSLLDLLSF